LIGKTIVDCDMYDFDFVNIRDNVCALKLNKNFINLYGRYANNIQLSINIDLDELKKKNIVFY